MSFHLQSENIHQRPLNKDVYNFTNITSKMCKPQTLYQSTKGPNMTQCETITKREKNGLI